MTWGYWSRGYFGGAVAVLGGAALLDGSLPLTRARTASFLRDRHGGGLALLANSRPLEGLIVSLPAPVVLLVWMFRKPGPSAPRRWAAWGCRCCWFCR